MEFQTQIKASSSPFTPVQNGLLQRKSASGCLAGECTERSKKRLMHQRRSINDDELSEIHPIAHEVLRSHKQPLDAVTRAFKRFGHDFSKIQVRSTRPETIQTKLKINKPGDLYEQEADRVAEQVMRMPEAQRQPEEEPVQTKPATTPLIQRQIGEEIEEEEEEEILQAKENTGHTPPEVTSDLESRVQSLKGGGHPLSSYMRAFMEPRFGYDFSQVRIHEDSRATALARMVNARAFTVGRDIVFGSGHYNPRTTVGKRLLAHELTHVVQQRGNTHVSGADYIEGLIQRDLQRIEDLLREKFDDPKDPRLHERRKSLNLEFRLLIPSDAKVLLDRIMSLKKDDIISERFQTLARSPRRELLLILFDKLEHIDAEILHKELTQAPKTPKEKQLKARFKEMEPEKKNREELLDRLHSKFSSAHEAPSGKKTPWVNLKDENFKTTGPISPDNNCNVCGNSEFNNLGVDWSTARNAMELRGDVSGHRSNAKYDFKRTRESGTWIKVGSWRQIDYDAPGTDDDTLGNDDEHLTPDPGLNHIYSVDAPGFSSLNPADVHFIPRHTNEYVRKHSFVEWVIVKVGTGRWTVDSTFFQWHTSVWLEKVNGKWRRKKDELNEILPGFMPVGKQDIPF